jgi:hypothetical protein
VFPRRYKRIMTLLGVLALIMAIDGVALIVLMLSFGLAFPLIYAATGLVYGACLAPAMYAWREGAMARWTGVATSLVALVVLALVPPWLSRHSAQSQADAWAAGDHIAEPASGARSIEIRRSAGSHDGFFEDDAPCGPECRGLLLSGQADWIRVVMVDGMTDEHGRRTVPVATRHEAASGDACAAPGFAADDDSRCVLIAADDDQAAALRLTFSDGGRSSLPDESVRTSEHWFRWRRVVGELLDTHDAIGSSGSSMRDADATTRRAGAVDPQRNDRQRIEVLRRSAAAIDVIGSPTVFGPEFEGMTSHGIHPQRGREQFRPITLAGALADLGYSASETAGQDRVLPAGGWRSGVNAEMTRQATGVLDLPVEREFSDAETRILYNWITFARGTTEWTPDLVEILRRIAGDQRMQRPSVLGVIMIENPVVARRLLPDVLDRLEADSHGDENNMGRQIASAFERMDPELLAPHRDRILALMQLGGRTREVLLRSAGLLGIDPLPMLEPFVADVDSLEWSPRARGACFAEDRWSDRLVPALRRAVREAPEVGLDKENRNRNDRIHDYRNRLLVALFRHGDREFVREQLVGWPATDKRRLKHHFDKPRRGATVQDVCNF